ncbi:MAG: hypothetical protein GX443_12120 [Deltaproteobacteria bacterium]|nr:hypothetical protein [Deltaproteobacteria bacterium]
MNRKLENLKPMNLPIMAMMVMIALSWSVLADTVYAKRGGGDRARYYGIIESRPVQGFHGQWVIGGHTITTGPQTQFDETEGPLAVGSCAKVDFRNGQVHEIDIEPMRDCQKRR